MSSAKKQVVIWSACNEIECWVTGNANVTGAQMRAATKKWDTTRPFSANLNQVKDPKLNDTLQYLGSQLDVLGFSHGSVASAGAAELHTTFPSKPVISSECCSCQTQRGEDYINHTVGLHYAHTLSQAQCMTKCMSYSYPCHKDTPGTCESTAMGTVAGTLGVWTLFGTHALFVATPTPHPRFTRSFFSHLLTPNTVHVPCLLHLRLWRRAWPVAHSLFVLRYVRARALSVVACFCRHLHSHRMPYPALTSL